MEDKEITELVVNLINEHPKELVRFLAYVYKSGMIIGFGLLQEKLDNPKIVELDPIENHEIFDGVVENTLINLVKNFSEKIEGEYFDN